MRPRYPRAQRERGLGVEQQQTVEASAQLASGVGRVARIKAERKTAAGEIGLAVRRRMEVLCLDCGVRREPAVDGREAIAAFYPPAERLRVEARAEMIAGKGEAVGRHPVIGVGERRGEIGGTRARRAVEAGLERV